MATLRSVLAADQNVDEARKVLEKRYKDADIGFEERNDFLGHRWTEAVVNL